MFATLDDVSTRLGRPITDPAEAAQVMAWIGDVTRRITKRLPGLGVDVTNGVIDVLTVRAVIAAVVIRTIKNPDGFRSERIDDYYYDRGKQSDDLTDLEWSQLSPLAVSGAFSVRPGFVPDGLPGWVWM